MKCRDFFDTHGDNKKKCKILQGYPEEQLLAWESEIASEFSPGAVVDTEVLYQQIVDPTHISPGGEGLKAMAFDVCSSHGLSVHRKGYATCHDLIKYGNDRAEAYNNANPEKSKRTLFGFAPFFVAKIREIVCKENMRRGFFIFDTATNNDISHAEICQGVLPKELQREYRFMLYDMVKGKIISLNDFQNPN